LHDIPAVGVPGASNWRESRDAEHLDGIPVIYVVVEPDQGGAAVRGWVARSRIRERVSFVKLADAKDPSELFIRDPGGFRESWERAIASARAWAEVTRLEAEVAHQQDWSLCEALAKSPNILDEFARELEDLGHVGEEHAAQLLFLVVVSRLLDRPVSAVVKGPSSAGKSRLVEQVLRFFPPEASYALSAMSEKALIYSEEPLKHRIMVIYEAAGITGLFATYLVRSLLSEGRVRYETVEKAKEGLQPRLIERDGPTGLILTTTAIRLHPENETRMLSIPVADTPEQTSRVLMALAAPVAATTDVERWHALQRWLARNDRPVVIPFAQRLAGLIPPVAVRLRRDFGAVLTLITSHASLHRATRSVDGQGRIVATLEDYEAVRDLVGPLIASGVDAMVPEAIRETVSAVARLRGSDSLGVSVTAVATELKLDKSTAWRRCQSAIERGYLRNLETRRGRPADLVLGDPLPRDIDVLPDPLALLMFAGVAETTGVPDTAEPSLGGDVS
jgi:hypothetical protein